MSNTWADEKWSFRDHFDYAAAKARRVASALARLLPNLRGPREHTRKLYLAVVHSVLMYGAPVWYEALGRGRAVAPFAAVQRLMAARVVREYHTVALEAVRALARVPPADLLARQQAERFLRFREYRNTGMEITLEREELVNQEVGRALVRR